MKKEGFEFFTKIILPALIVSVVSIAVEIKQKKAKFWNSFLSAIISVGGAYIFSDLIIASVGDKLVLVAVAFVAIMTDKFMSWVLFTFKIDTLMDALTTVFIDKLTNYKNKK